MTASELALFGAVLGQIALTVVLYLALVRTRFSLMKDRSQVRPEMAFDQAAWPVKQRLVSNAVISQFELPVLFYAGALFAFVLGAANWTTAILAWAFVATRVIHALIHTGANVVMQRLSVFIAGFLILIVLWIGLAAKVFGAA